jgi:hypothetical protein
VDILKAETLLERGDQRAARNVVTRVIRAEPMNLGAWIALGKASHGDPALLLRVIERARALEPLLPPQT